MGPQDFSGQIGRHAFANTSEVPTIAGCEFGEPSAERWAGEQGQPLSFRGIKQFAAGTLLTPAKKRPPFSKSNAPPVARASSRAVRAAASSSGESFLFP